MMTMISKKSKLTGTTSQIATAIKPKKEKVKVLATSDFNKGKTAPVLGAKKAK